MTHFNDVCLKTFERPRVDLNQSKIGTVVLVCFSCQSQNIIIAPLNCSGAVLAVKRWRRGKGHGGKHLGGIKGS